MIQITENCLQLNDFFGAQIFYSALSHPVIARMKKTFAALSPFVFFCFFFDLFFFFLCCFFFVLFFVLFFYVVFCVVFLYFIFSMERKILIN